MQVAFRLFLVSLEIAALALTIYGAVRLARVKNARKSRMQGQCYLFSQVPPCYDCNFQVKLIVDGSNRLLQAAFAFEFANSFGQTVVVPDQYFGCCIQSGLDCCKFFEADTNKFCDNWGGASCHSGLWNCSFLLDAEGEPIDVKAELLNDRIYSLLIGISAISFVLLVHVHYSGIRKISNRLLHFLYKNGITQAILSVLKHILLVPYYFLVLAIPESLKEKYREYKLKKNSKSPRRLKTTSENSADDQQPELPIQPIDGQTLSTEEKQIILLKSLNSAGDLGSGSYSIPSLQAVPGIVEEVSPVLPPLPAPVVQRRREVLLSRTPVQPPLEPQTFARHIELPAPPRASGRPRDRKAREQLQWWGSGLPRSGNNN